MEYLNHKEILRFDPPTHLLPEEKLLSSRVRDIINSVCPRTNNSEADFVENSAGSEIDESCIAKIYKNLLSDPYLFSKVAAFNTLSPACLSNQPGKKIIRLVVEYCSTHQGSCRKLPWFS